MSRRHFQPALSDHVNPQDLAPIEFFICTYAVCKHRALRQALRATWLSPEVLKSLARNACIAGFFLRAPINFTSDRQRKRQQVGDLAKQVEDHGQYRFRARPCETFPKLCLNRRIPLF
jgi:hypothetical protein